MTTLKFLSNNAIYNLSEAVQYLNTLYNRPIVKKLLQGCEKIDSDTEEDVYIKATHLEENLFNTYGLQSVRDLQSSIIKTIY